jgi:hypothetical protein
MRQHIDLTLMPKDKPPAKRPADFNVQLKAIGYRP